MSILDPKWSWSSPAMLEVRKKLVAKGRSHFIFYTGMLRWGGSVFVLTTLWSWHGRYGWHAPPRAELLSNSLYVAFRLALWLTGGYFFGVRLWRKIVLEDTATEGPTSR